MASAFSRVPLEILITILEKMPDLPSLYRFICASAQVNTAFELAPASMLDQVIDRSIPHFKHLARTISIMGSLNIQTVPDFRSSCPSSQPTLTFFVDKFNSLPKDVLTTASPSHAFSANTPGPRYLLLTAYRIEHLFHICFVILLQNIHELIFEGGPSPDCKKSATGVFFEPVAWFSPSWAERYRIEQALWKIFINWNLGSISVTVPTDPCFSVYSSFIQALAKC